jgi:hypothetical protein
MCRQVPRARDAFGLRKAITQVGALVNRSAVSFESQLTPPPDEVVSNAGDCVTHFQHQYRRHLYTLFFVGES